MLTQDQIQAARSAAGYGAMPAGTPVNSQTINKPTSQSQSFTDSLGIKTGMPAQPVPPRPSAPKSFTDTLGIQPTQPTYDWSNPQSSSVGGPSLNPLTDIGNYVKNVWADIYGAGKNVVQSAQNEHQIMDQSTNGQQGAVNFMRTSGEGFLSVAANAIGALFSPVMAVGQTALPLSQNDSTNPNLGGLGKAIGQGAIAGGAAGTIIPGAGTLAGAGIGAGVGALYYGMTAMEQLLNQNPKISAFLKQNPDVTDDIHNAMTLGLTMLGGKAGEGETGTGAPQLGGDVTPGAGTPEEGPSATNAQGEPLKTSSFDQPQNTPDMQAMVEKTKNEWIKEGATPPVAEELATRGITVQGEKNAGGTDASQAKLNDVSQQKFTGTLKVLQDKLDAQGVRISPADVKAEAIKAINESTRGTPDEKIAAIKRVNDSPSLKSTDGIKFSEAEQAKKASYDAQNWSNNALFRKPTVSNLFNLGLATGYKTLLENTLEAHSGPLETSAGLPAGTVKAMNADIGNTRAAQSFLKDFNPEKAVVQPGKTFGMKMLGTAIRAAAGAAGEVIGGPLGGLGGWTLTKTGVDMFLEKLGSLEPNKRAEALQDIQVEDSKAADIIKNYIINSNKESSNRLQLPAPGQTTQPTPPEPQGLGSDTNVSPTQTGTEQPLPNEQFGYSGEDTPGTLIDAYNEYLNQQKVASTDTSTQLSPRQQKIITNKAMKGSGLEGKTAVEDLSSKIKGLGGIKIDNGAASDWKDINQELMAKKPKATYTTKGGTRVATKPGLSPVDMANALAKMGYPELKDLDEKGLLDKFNDLGLTK